MGSNQRAPSIKFLISSILLFVNLLIRDGVPYMMRRMRKVFYSFVLLVVLACSVYASKVTLWIQATNPLSKDQSVQIKSNLPAGIGTNDIINLDGLELGYDIRNDIYFVHKKAELGAKGSGSEHVEYRIELRDIWTFQEEALEGLLKQSTSLVAMLAGTTYEKEANDLVSIIKEKLAAIKQKQDDSSIDKTSVINHIRAYEQSMEDFARVEHDVGLMENLVLSTGQDPGSLLGKVKDMPGPDHDFKLAPEQYKVATIIISVFNTSPTETRIIPNSVSPMLRRDLPSEIKIGDILDAGGLEIGSDPKNGICYLYKERLEVPPSETVTFAVKIRDKWNINAPRIVSLKERALDLQAQILEAKTKVKSIEELISRIITKIDDIEKESGPQSIDDKYVAFFRGQTKRLDDVEEQMNRIRSALKPMEKTAKLGFKAKPPSMKSTWMIIYIILGFLALVSLLFFLRWYGKSKEEKLDSGGGQ